MGQESSGRGDWDEQRGVLFGRAEQIFEKREFAR